MRPQQTSVSLRLTLFLAAIVLALGLAIASADEDDFKAPDSTSKPSDTKTSTSKPGDDSDSNDSNNGNNESNNSTGKPDKESGKNETCPRPLRGLPDKIKTFHSAIVIQLLKRSCVPQPLVLSCINRMSRGDFISFEEVGCCKILDDLCPSVLICSINLVCPKVKECRAPVLRGAAELMADEYEKDKYYSRIQAEKQRIEAGGKAEKPALRLPGVTPRIPFLPPFLPQYNVPFSGFLDGPSSVRSLPFGARSPPRFYRVGPLARQYG